MPVRKYRKKALEIEAILWTGYNKTEIKAFAGDNAIFYERKKDNKEHLLIDSLEGFVHAPKGHYIIKGIQGEFYPVEGKVFKKTYDLVE